MSLAVRPYHLINGWLPEHELSDRPVMRTSRLTELGRIPKPVKSFLSPVGPAY